MRIILVCFVLALVASCSEQPNSGENAHLILTILATNDVHGELLPDEFTGGLTTFSGYVAAARAARAEDGGALLLIDAGDMWQGTLESNLEEGAPVVEIYNALAYTAVTIGNHEFDFGPVGELAIPAGPEDDPQGALRQRVAEAKFPVLSANIVDLQTGKLVDWDNVTPSTLTEAAGVKIGIIGIITARALQATIAANGIGLEIAPLADAIVREATGLRAQGADIVIVTAHAGGECTEFNDPHDLSSCNLDGEIAKVANALPAGLVDHIIAGHAHNAMAHIINGIAVTSSYSNTYAFDRVDFVIHRETGRVVDRKVFPPQINCPAYFIANNDCAWVENDLSLVAPATYEGHPVQAMPSVLAIAERASALSAVIKSESLGVTLETPFDLTGNPESLLGNLFTDAVLESANADIAIHNVSGGIRATLPAGEVTFGKIYEIFPFDNFATIIELSGAELRQIISAQVIRQHRLAGFSGMRVSADCDDGAPVIEMVLSDGRVIADDDLVRVVANDFLVMGGDDILTPAMPAGGFEYAGDMPLTRDLLVQWFKKRGGRITAADFDSGSQRRWNLTESCTF